MTCSFPGCTESMAERPQGIDNHGRRQRGSKHILPWWSRREKSKREVICLNSKVSRELYHKNSKKEVRPWFNQLTSYQASLSTYANYNST